MVVSTAVSRIPFEIWLRIRDLVGPVYSDSLYSLNRIWFEIVMNSRYRDLDITQLNETVLSRLPLLKDPGIAKRIRHLSISGAALQISLLGSITGQRVKFPMDRNTLSTLNRRICALDVTNVLNTHVRLISGIISGLNPSEYSVKWDFHEGIQSGEIIHASLQGAILDVAWPAFGSTLKKLYVSARPERFNAVLSSDVHLLCLEELHLELLPMSEGVQSIGIRDIFPEYASSFLARVNLDLDVLSIQSSSNLDLSCVFHQLSSFINLHRLLLHILADHDTLSDPSGLQSFFAHSAPNLRHLTLFLYHATVSSPERVLPSLAMSRARIPRLETLEINFGMPHPKLENTLLCELHDLFRGARSTLHTIILEGIALSLTDLKAATSVFASGDTLQSLTVSLLTLTAQHIATLAENASSISALGIIFMHLSLVPDGPAAEVEGRVQFKTQIGEHEYPEWNLLQDISIWQHSRSVDTSRWDLVSPFPACVPTITRFFGHPVPQPSQARSIPVTRILSALV